MGNDDATAVTRRPRSQEGLPSTALLSAQIATMPLSLIPLEHTRVIGVGGTELMFGYGFPLSLCNIDKHCQP
jgi:hypothetical protein